MNERIDSDRGAPDPFGPKTTDGKLEELNQRLVDWSRQHCSCARPFERHAAFARPTSIYVLDCAQRDTTLEEAVLLAKDVLLFFLVDDHCTVEELEELVRFLEGGRPWSSEIIGFYRSLVDELQRLGMETGPFHRATIEMCKGILAERRLIRSRVSPREYFELRRLTAAVGPYFECWIALRHRRLAGRAATLWSELEMFNLLSDITGLTNDLGSVERDTSHAMGAWPEVSYLYIRHADHPGLDTLIESTIELTNRLIDKAQNRLLLLEEAAVTMNEPRLLDYVDFAIELINGSRRSIVRLSGRYPGALERIRRVRELDRNR
jgi:hypothetical protein